MGIPTAIREKAALLKGDVSPRVYRYNAPKGEIYRPEFPSVIEAISCVVAVL